MAYSVLSAIFVLVYMIISFFLNVSEGKRMTPSSWGWLAVRSVVASGLFGALTYISLPVIAYNAYAIYVEVFAFVVVTLVVESLFHVDSNLLENTTFTCSLTGLGVLLVAGLVVLIYQCDIFHSTSKQQMLDPTVKTEASDSIVAATDVQNLCTISKEVARKAIMVQMGDLKNTYEISALTKQSATCDFEATLASGKKVRIQYDDHIIYVGVLEHRSFWTWNKQKYSPAYVIADASDADKVYVVTEVNGKKLEIAYTNGAYFGYNLERHMRFEGYAGVILADFDMEINEQGLPFAPVTTMENSIGLSTPVVTGVAVVNLQSGDIKQYTPENAPAFINMIQPADVIYDRINWWVTTSMVTSTGLKNQV